jgi:small subunit ribosomal protein S20
MEVKVMPNIKSTKKRVKTTAKTKEHNNFYMASMRTAVKKVDKLNPDTKVAEAKKALANALKIIDEVLAKGLIHKNKAARLKSRLTKKVNQIK